MTVISGIRGFIDITRIPVGDSAFQLDQVNQSGTLIFL